MEDLANRTLRVKFLISPRRFITNLVDSISILPREITPGIFFFKKWEGVDSPFTTHLPEASRGVVASNKKTEQTKIYNILYKKLFKNCACLLLAISLTS